MIFDSTGLPNAGYTLLNPVFLLQITVDNDQGLSCHYFFLPEVSGRGESDLWISIYSFKDVLSCASAVGEFNSVVFLKLLMPQNFGLRI